jgi:hypothetical protein
MKNARSRLAPRVLPWSGSKLGVGGGSLEAIATADGGGHQVQRRVLGMRARFGQRRGRLTLGADLDDLRPRGGIVLTEMRAKPALTFMNLNHIGTSLGLFFETISSDQLFKAIQQRG